MIDLNEQAQNTAALSNLYRIQSLLDLMQVLVNQTSGAEGATILPTINANLYKIAAQYYGSSDQWTIIATANGLIDPEVVGPKNLIIPAWDGVDRGGKFGS